MPIPTGLNNLGTLLINPGGVTAGTLETNMRGTGWWVLDYLPLVSLADERGDNVVIPGAAGRRAYPRQREETTLMLPMLVTGAVTRAGATTADVLSGAWGNLDDLRANVAGPYDGTTTTRAARFTLPNATVLNANVQCHISDLNPFPARDLFKAVLTLTIPSGRFA